MITLDDYKNLIDLFDRIAVPEELTNFVAKLRVMYEELSYRDEVQKKLAEYRSKLEELNKNDSKEE